MRTVIGSIFNPNEAVLVSTVRLPIQIDGHSYETCIFYGRDSDVAARYDSLMDMIIGHFKLVRAIKYGGSCAY